MTHSDVWSAAAADRYDALSGDMFRPEVLGPTVDFLAALAAGGRVLEFAIGTGRVAIPLAERGLDVTGIELSAPMAAKVAEKRPGLPVVVGDMATTRVEGEFALVYLVFNTLGNLNDQEAQIACFANAAAHLASGGRFVIESTVPAIRRLPPTQGAIPFEVAPERHIGVDTYDLVTQKAISHHLYRNDDGSYRYAPHHFRYTWPSECDLMARLAGLALEERVGDWHRAPFTGESTSHVSVYRKG